MFWNSEEKRLRALWRLVLQGVVWFGLQFVGQTVIGIVLAVTGMASGAITSEELADPAAMTAFITGQPAVVLALQLITLVATLLTVWLAGRFLDRRRFADFGLHLNRDWWLDFGFGLLLGAVLMLLIFLVELAAGWVAVTGFFVTRDPGAPFALTILLPLVIFIIVGFQEELFSRGYQLTNLAEGLNGMGPVAAILLATVISSAVFGLLHAANPNASAISTFNIFLAGVFLATGFILTGELAIPIGLHMTWNFFQGNVFGFPVSGTDFRSATFIGIEQGGPELWTGGAFGPEAGLLGIGAMVLGVLLTVLWVRLRYGSAALDRDIPAPPERVQRDLVEDDLRAGSPQPG